MGAAGLLWAALWALLLPLVAADEGILHASGSGVPPVTKDYCIIYNSNWLSLPKTLDNATFRTLENLTSTVLCSSAEVPSGLMKDKAVVVMRGNCTFLEKARIAQSLGAKMLLIASKSRLSAISDNKTGFEDVTLPIALIRYNDIVDMQLVLGNEVNVTLYSPPLPEFDYSMVVIFLIAVFTVALGGYWSGVAELITCSNKTIEVRLIFLAIFCIAAAVVWAVFRNEDRWAWILQDILGVAFCLNFIKTLKMPNFKSCVILLGLLLLYDVFFVFITPFITKNGASIMVEVAAGPFGNSEKSDGNLVEVPTERSAPHEKLPVVIRVPRLEHSASTLCDLPFSLLGFGDIIVPGLLVAYCRRFDVQTRSSSIYYISCTIAYAVGMVLTFIVLALMKMGQPALLYLVPCTLITSSLIAWRRKEMKKFWKGSNYQVSDSSRTPLLQGMMEHLDYTGNEESTASATEQPGGQ
uniref:signal peptide peptidase-like 2A isoform X5 n=1 Tax=Agelaius phoeniceus TaxID=39638 RepID=UPI0023EBFFB5|nr:signal peptide peptidase-like 2A isoform X5 [Agelaius phoeniceus]